MALPKAIVAHVKGHHSFDGDMGFWDVQLNDGQKLQGSEESASSFRMELTAVLETVRHFKSLQGVDKLFIKSDTDYIKRGANNWLKVWKREGWMKKDGEPVVNQDLWKSLDEEMSALGNRVFIERAIDEEASRKKKAAKRAAAAAPAAAQAPPAPAPALEAVKRAKVELLDQPFLRFYIPIAERAKANAHEQQPPNIFCGQTYKYPYTLDNNVIATLPEAQLAALLQETTTLATEIDNYVTHLFCIVAEDRNKAKVCKLWIAENGQVDQSKATAENIHKHELLCKEYQKTQEECLRKVLFNYGFAMDMQDLLVRRITTCVARAKDVFAGGRADEETKKAALEFIEKFENLKR